MPLIKKDESLPKRKVIILIHGEPGLGKTSLFNTCDGLLLDFEEGVARSHKRKDTVVVDRNKGWQDVLDEETKGTFNGYKTIGIDTPKSMLDETLMPFVKNRDYALRKNIMKAYGVMGDEAKDFYGRLRALGADIVNMVHTVTEKDGDKFIKVPDVTGQTLQFLKRISDQIGYMYSENGQRILDFRIQDGVVTKDTANLGKMIIPDINNAAYEGWLPREVIEKVRNTIESMDEEQLATLQFISKWHETIDAVKLDDASLKALSTDISQIAEEHLKKQVRAYLSAHLKKVEWKWDAPNKVFVPVNPPATPVDDKPIVTADDMVKEAEAQKAALNEPPTEDLFAEQK